MLLTALITSWGCKRKGDTGTEGYDKVLYEPQYASGFKIFGEEGTHNSIVRIFNPWQGADDVSLDFFIDRDNTGAPEGFEGQIIKGNAGRVVCMSSTHIAMLDALGATDRTVGVSGLGYISNKNIRAGSDTIADVGYEGNINYENLVSSKPDVVLLYGVNAASSMENKLVELGIPYIYIGDYVEDSPLGKAEWMVAVAELLGMREEGIDAFGSIPRNYNALTAMVDSIAESKPKVMLNAPYGDVWYLPCDGSYMSRIIADAGGDYVFGGNAGNSTVPVDMEKALKLISEAQVWINAGDAVSLEELKRRYPRFADSQSVRDRKVYNNNKRVSPGGGNDFYESGTVRPDLILRDLVKIFYPGVIEEDFVYYLPLE